MTGLLALGACDDKPEGTVGDRRGFNLTDDNRGTAKFGFEEHQIAHYSVPVATHLGQLVEKTITEDGYTLKVTNAFKVAGIEGEEFTFDMSFEKAECVDRAEFIDLYNNIEHEFEGSSQSRRCWRTQGSPM